jgi:hypothetical protein
MAHSRFLAIDLFCGLFGWGEALAAEGYDVIGFDLEDMRGQFGFHRLPHTQLVIQDVLTLHGSQFKDAALIVASPPCQAYSYRAMPWKRAKSLPPPDNTLFEACFRIQKEACEAAGRHVPLIVENVRGAQKWVGRARWNFGSFYLWGDVPALMPMMLKATKVGATSGYGQNPDGRKTNGHSNVRDGHPHTRHLTNPDEHEGVKQRGSGCEWWDKALDERRKEATAINRDNTLRKHHSGHSSRRFASAMIAKIPQPLARHIAVTFHLGLTPKRSTA